MQISVPASIRGLCAEFFSSDPRTRVRAEIGVVQNLILFLRTADPEVTRAWEVSPIISRAISSYRLALGAQTVEEQEAAALVAIQCLRSYCQTVGIDLQDLDEYLHGVLRNPMDSHMEAFVGVLKIVFPQVSFWVHPGSDRFIPAKGCASYGTDYRGKYLRKDEILRSEVPFLLGALPRVDGQVMREVSDAIDRVLEDSGKRSDSTARALLLAAKFRTGRVPYRGKKGVLFQALIASEGETVSLSELRELVESDNVGRMCREIERDGRENGAWSLCFVRRDVVIFLRNQLGSFKFE